jgi:molybdopterin-guanine dinucleotide biosynthesis protein A
MASAAILVGGRAARFGGRDKSALVVGGRAIRDRQLAELSRIADELLIVGDGAKGPWHHDGGAHVPVRAIPDRVRGSGPLAGLEAALATAQHDVVVLVACDMPFVTAELAGHLVSLARTAEAVVPRTRRGYHPLCAAYTRSCRPVVSRLLAEGRLAMSGVLEAVRLREVAGDELQAFGDPDHMLANVNTAADYERLVAAELGHTR